MRKNYTKKLYTVLGVILFISTVNALHVTIQGIGGLVSPDSFGIQWLNTDKWMQVTVLVGRMVGGLVFSALLYAFTINTVKGYKAGVLFPRKNFGILMACSVALFVYVFCYDNMQLVGLPNDAVRQIELQKVESYINDQIFNATNSVLGSYNLSALVSLISEEIRTEQGAGSREKATCQFAGGCVDHESGKFG